MFQEAGDTGWLGRTLSALADTEDQRGHGDAALRLERDALRYTYLAGDVPAIAISYRNLGTYLHLHARQPAKALSSHLATALIGSLAGIGGNSPASPQAAIRAATADLREFGTAAIPPRDIAELCDQLSGIPGTDLPRLIATLTPDPETAERALRDLIAKATRTARPWRHQRARRTR
jgi:hypothetical protein